MARKKQAPRVVVHKSKPGTLSAALADAAVAADARAAAARAAGRRTAHIIIAELTFGSPMDPPSEEDRFGGEKSAGHVSGWKDRAG